MKRTTLLFLLLTINYSFSQKLFITKRDYSSGNVSTHIHSLQEINQTNGNLISNYNFSTSFPNSYSPRSLSFNYETNEIIGEADGIIVKYNIDTGIETSFNLPSTLNTNYGEIIFVKNRLFITKRNYSRGNVSTYIHSLQEINQTNGNIISNYNFSTSFPNSYSPRSLSFNYETNEIIGEADGIIVKYNIDTGIETSFNLPSTQNTNYGEIIFVKNRLFITKRNYSSGNVSTYIHSLQEINQTNGNLISNYNFSTSFPNSYSPRSLSFNYETNEIIGEADGIIVKYNIDTGIETSFNLPTTLNTNYGEIIFINTRDYSLSINKNNSISNIPKPIKAYDLIGKEVSTNTKNEVIIVVYKNGSRKKIFQIN
ncbi:hypothetical protein [Thalassobellus suaedae]|uniref:Uncharacterized protein n=1 Tax=Thalassobellus suaedae TaxID=3074124 RepID=A0ABY9Y6L6_9FLAO|nr:hypothetical protein RHP49_06500 [Flavobacteriaceae bacterium HL-DH10]